MKNYLVKKKKKKQTMDRPLTESELGNFLSKAKNVMRQTENMKVNHKEINKLMESDPMNSTTITESSYSAPTFFTETQFENSGLPKEILESIRENPNIASPTSSPVDAIAKNMPKLVEKKEVQSMPVGNTAVVDYSMIKMIVEECMRKYTSSIKKGLLIEGKSQGNSLDLITLKGNKMKLVDGKGNIYEAELKLKGNINQK